MKFLYTFDDESYILPPLFRKFNIEPVLGQDYEITTNADVSDILDIKPVRGTVLSSGFSPMCGSDNGEETVIDIRTGTITNRKINPQ